WLRELGIRWEPAPHTEVDGRIYFPQGEAISPAGDGFGALLRWREIAENLGIELRYSSPVSDLYGDHRAVEGVRVTGEAGAYDVRAAAVILCSGGFQANAEMRARYLGPNADYIKVRG